MVAGTCCAAVSFAIGISKFGYLMGMTISKGPTFDKHAHLGIATMVVTLSQTILGFMRLPPDAEFRWLWRLLHRVLGVATIGVGAAGIATGIQASGGMESVRCSRPAETRGPPRLPVQCIELLSGTVVSGPWIAAAVIAGSSLVVGQIAATVRCSVPRYGRLSQGFLPQTIGWILEAKQLTAEHPAKSPVVHPLSSTAPLSDDAM